LSVSQRPSAPELTCYDGASWTGVRLPTEMRDWAHGGWSSIARRGDSLASLAGTLHSMNAAAAWRWPRRTRLFFSDLHGDPEAFAASLVASGGVRKTGTGPRDLELLVKAPAPGERVAADHMQVEIQGHVRMDGLDGSDYDLLLLIDRSRAGRPGAPDLLAAQVQAARSLVAGLASRQLEHWRDSETLMQHALDATGENYVAHTYLGVARLAGVSAFGMSGTDIETAARSGAAITTVLLNNGGMATYPGGFPTAREQYGVSHMQGDYAMIAEGMGATGITAKTPAEVAEALKRAQQLNAEGTTVLIDVHSDMEGQRSRWDR